ncbi:hypothetical protein HanRHA438_Chr16g0738391 [Helianthus annuus]|nr:hypothetical protein HanRHA438_Chr16g0738391 [Helianthus annuus]
MGSARLSCWDLVSGLRDKVDLGVLYLSRVHYIFKSPKVIPKIYTRSPSS